MPLGEILVWDIVGFITYFQLLHMVVAFHFTQTKIHAKMDNEIHMQKCTGRGAMVQDKASWLSCR